MLGTSASSSLLQLEDMLPHVSHSVVDVNKMMNVDPAAYLLRCCRGCGDGWRSSDISLTGCDDVFSHEINKDKNGRTITKILKHLETDIKKNNDKNEIGTVDILYQNRNIKMVMVPIFGNFLKICRWIHGPLWTMSFHFSQIDNFWTI